MGGARKPRIYLIKFAMGSSSLAEDWAPDGDYFPQFVNFTKEMLEVIAREGVPPKIDCFMWHQGNTDAGTGKWKNAYQANLVKFVKETWRALEASCSAPFPFVPLELHTSSASKMKSYVKINAASHDACQELGAAARMKKMPPDMVDEIKSNFKEDKIHSNSH